MSTPTSAEREAFGGLVERVTYHNAENGFCVLRVKARGQRDLVTVVGAAAAISAGEFIQASGIWINDRTHGLQFKAAFLKSAPPTTLEGIERYLGSGMIKGIGPVYAKKLVQAFGAAVFDAIEQAPERLQEVAGIGPKRALRIRTGWAEQKVIREIMLFLHGHGVGTSRAVRIFKTYGADAVQVISENPYRLARDIRGIGFKSADQIAMRLGIAKTAMIRARAGISYALAEAMDEGHCGLPTDELRERAAALLEITVEVVDAAIALELADGAVIGDTAQGRPCLFLAGLYRAEQGIAERLLRLSRGSPPWPAVDPDRAIPWVEQRTGLVLAASQREAVRLALSSKLLVITGGPGVGKTTLVNAILEILRARTASIALAAPTGRAAKRMREATGLEAKTLHRLLEADPARGGFKRDEEHQLDCELLVVDEVSMVDVRCCTACSRRYHPGPPCSWSATSIRCPRSGQARCWPTSSAPETAPLPREGHASNAARPACPDPRPPRRSARPRRRLRRHQGRHRRPHCCQGGGDRDQGTTRAPRAGRSSRIGSGGRNARAAASAFWRPTAASWRRPPSRSRTACWSRRWRGHGGGRRLLDSGRLRLGDRDRRGREDQQELRRAGSCGWRCWRRTSSRRSWAGGRISG